MENFTPISGFIGGCLIGLAAIALMRFNRKICGISGIYFGALRLDRWRVFFVLGLFTGGILLRLFYPHAFDYTISSSTPAVILGGFLVGFGSRFGNGCTSGHGVCGIGRLARRSLIATATFFITGLITASTLYLIKG